ncbi:MAG: class I SAM-dependent methyltransferase [Candidatus Bathyarchaeia archaeon]|nr:class I SAM-dependent methyltransferase [Candidatus Bathyarchaeia archaeon]
MWNVIRRNIVGCRRLLDLGCGSGRVLQRLMEEANVCEACGMDLSGEKLVEAHVRCPSAELVHSDSVVLPFKDGSFEVVFISLMLHEVESLKGLEGVKITLDEVSRVLERGGRVILIDHLNPGKKMITVWMDSSARVKFNEFVRRFSHHKVQWFDLEDGLIKISKGDLQEFATKFKSLNSEIEMKETHAPFTKAQIVRILMKCGLKPKKVLGFQNIKDQLLNVGVELMDAEPWKRKILCVAKKLDNEKAKRSLHDNLFHTLERLPSPDVFV